MREIEFDRKRGKIHGHLSSQSVQKAFKQNIKDKKHSTKSKYNHKDLKQTLKDVYYQKCAFCESYIKNEVGDIEHYRPKNKADYVSKKCDKTYSYYWLAFSWDNLLPSCSKCNGKKSNCFDILGTRASYKGEDLKYLHNKMVTTHLSKTGTKASFLKTFFNSSITFRPFFLTVEI